MTNLINSSSTSVISSDSSTGTTVGISSVKGSENALINTFGSLQSLFSGYNENMDYSFIGAILLLILVLVSLFDFLRRFTSKDKL